MLEYLKTFIFPTQTTILVDIQNRRRVLLLKGKQPLSRSTTFQLSTRLQATFQISNPFWEGYSLCYWRSASYTTLIIIICHTIITENIGLLTFGPTNFGLRISHKIRKNLSCLNLRSRKYSDNKALSEIKCPKFLVTNVPSYQISKYCDISFMSFRSNSYRLALKIPQNMGST